MSLRHQWLGAVEKDIVTLCSVAVAERGAMVDLTDVLDAAARSLLMSKIRGKDTEPEMQVRRSLHAAGYRFRLHQKNLPGRPDIVLPKLRIVVFVNGCFWHGHQCDRFRWPASNDRFWREKIVRNMSRDQEAYAKLADLGWCVHVIWTCTLARGLEELMARLKRGAQ